jgi:gamma-glutamylcyclotransferase (GGCT)/AIG2-like uncharacterized protein YtfP
MVNELGFIARRGKAANGTVTPFAARAGNGGGGYHRFAPIFAIGREHVSIEADSECGTMAGITSNAKNALFVYGTLMPGSRHPMARRLETQSAYLGPGWIGGKLHSLGWYPAAIPSSAPGSRVYGEVVRLHNPQATLSWLDAYEGCAPGQSEPHAYQRVIVPVTLNSGDKLDAWVYFYKLPVHSARHLPSGRFVQR